MKGTARVASRARVNDTLASLKNPVLCHGLPPPGFHQEKAFV